MRLSRAVLLAGLAVALLLALIWGMGGFTALRLWAEAGARAVQRDMALALRALARGQPGAMAGLLAVGFAYGFFHAAGPGHGKMLIGGYGLARRVPLRRLAGLALAASLAQSTVAVAMVYALILGLGWARTRVEGLAEALFLPLSHAAIMGIGLWLLIRGGRRLHRARRAVPGPSGVLARGPLGGRAVGGAVLLGGHRHRPDCAPDCAPDCGCGHAHGPTLDQAAAVTSWRAALALIAAIALRPCSGALFLLIVSWQMGIAGAGIAGVYAMGLGTASVTVVVAVLAVWSREGMWTGLGAVWPQRMARAVPVMELAAGALLLAVALPLLVASLERPGPGGVSARPTMAPSVSPPCPPCTWLDMQGPRATSGVAPGHA